MAGWQQIKKANENGTGDSKANYSGPISPTFTVSTSSPMTMKFPKEELSDNPEDPVNKVQLFRYVAPSLAIFFADHFLRPPRFFPRFLCLAISSPATSSTCALCDTLFDLYLT